MNNKWVVLISLLPIVATAQEGQETMDHSQHMMMDHSQHMMGAVETAGDTEQATEMDHSQHMMGAVGETGEAEQPAQMDHSQHMMDHSQHSMDHSQHDTGAAVHLHHGHGAGSVMLEYRFMRMTMSGLLDGSDEVSSSEVTDMAGYHYMMAPTEMVMDMHMVMGMYGINDKFGLMFMLNYLQNSMDMVDADNEVSSMSSSGLGDIDLGVMYSLPAGFMLNVNLGVPTGSISEEGEMMGEQVRLPYPMQLGSGTYDLKPSMTYNHSFGAMVAGGQATYIYRMGENEAGYALGDRLEMSGWLRYSMKSGVTLSGRLAYAEWGNIEGQDDEIAQTMPMPGMPNMKSSPTANPEAQGGARADLFLGASYMSGGGHMFGLEYGLPLLQKLNGPQMKTASVLSLAYQYSF